MQKINLYLVLDIYNYIILTNYYYKNRTIITTYSYMYTLLKYPFGFYTVCVPPYIDKPCVVKYLSDLHIINTHIIILYCKIIVNVTRVKLNYCFILCIMYMATKSVHIICEHCSKCL